MRVIRAWAVTIFIALSLMLFVTGSASAREDVFTLSPGDNNIVYPYTGSTVAKVSITLLETNAPATTIRIAGYLSNTGVFPGSDYMGCHDFSFLGDTFDYRPTNPSPGNINLIVTNSGTTNVVIKLKVEAYGG